MSEISTLNRYLPPNTSSYVLKLIKHYPVHFKIVKPRKTKLGDFKVNLKTGKLQITINNDLEPLNFLITTIHELAHLYNWQEYKKSIAPHGIEWKNEYKKLFLPILSTQFLSLEEVNLLHAHLDNPKASSCSDIMLTQYFKKEGVKHLEDIPIGKPFKLNGITYMIEKKLRKRFLCIQLATDRKYYINGLAEVEEVHLSQEDEKDHLNRFKVLSDSEIALRNLRKRGLKYIKDIALGKAFELNGNTFVNKGKIKKQFICVEQSSNTEYYLDGLIEVKEVNLPLQLQIDLKKEKLKRLNDIQIDKPFKLNGKTYVIEKKLRTRFLCIEQSSNRKYYINGLAEVEEL